MPRRQENKPTTIDAIHRDFHLQEAKKSIEDEIIKGPSSRSLEQALQPRMGPPQADDGWNTIPSIKHDPAKLKLTRVSAPSQGWIAPFVL